MALGLREVGFIVGCFIVSVTVIAVIVYFVYFKENQDSFPYRSCKDVPTKKSGKYYIRGKTSFDSYMAYCEQEKYGGGWMVIQHRFDGSVNFDRGWNDYKNGFGDVEGEHWLGLENIYQFTKYQASELLIEMKDFNNIYKYARYNLFRIDSEEDNYSLKLLGIYKGTAGDSLGSHEEAPFSTKDNDNTYDSDECVATSHGGWWFENCHQPFLNGPYRNVRGKEESMISWYSFNDEYKELSYTRMLIRPLN